MREGFEGVRGVAEEVRELLCYEDSQAQPVQVAFRGERGPRGVLDTEIVGNLVAERPDSDAIDVNSVGGQRVAETVKKGRRILSADMEAGGSQIRGRGDIYL